MGATMGDSRGNSSPAQAEHDLEPLPGEPFPAALGHPASLMMVDPELPARQPIDPGLSPVADPSSRPRIECVTVLFASSPRRSLA